jgi:hypothetical protein
LFGSLRNYGGLNKWGLLKNLASQQLVRHLCNTLECSMFGIIGLTGVVTMATVLSSSMLPHIKIRHLCFSSKRQHHQSLVQAQDLPGNTIAIGAPCAEFTSFVDVGAISLLSLRPVHRMPLLGGSCSTDADCGAGRHVTNPGSLYFSAPSIVASSALRTCSSLAGNVAAH